MSFIIHVYVIDLYLTEIFPGEHRAVCSGYNIKIEVIDYVIIMTPNIKVGVAQAYNYLSDEMLPRLTLYSF